jgi:hypothetical protein
VGSEEEDLPARGGGIGFENSDGSDAEEEESGAAERGTWAGMKRHGGFMADAAEDGSDSAEDTEATRGRGGGASASGGADGPR